MYLDRNPQAVSITESKGCGFLWNMKK